MKNTIENKVEFFAQYYGQNIIKCSHYKDNIDLKSMLSNIPGSKKYDVIRGSYLQLKPLSGITYEDSAYVSKILNSNPKELRKAINSGMVNMDLFPTRVGDYVRSKGYALPWNKITVEEMIDFGWLKLNEDDT